MVVAAKAVVAAAVVAASVFGGVTVASASPARVVPANGSGGMGASHYNPYADQPMGLPEKPYVPPQVKDVGPNFWK